MGISALIALKATTLLSLSLLTKNLGLKFISYPFLYSSLISFLISLFSLPSINLPLLLSKSSNGTFPLWSLLFFSPFFLFIRSFVPLRRLILNQPLYTQISDDLFVGGWPTCSSELPPGEISVVDCTCELPKRPCLNGKSYLCVATWDTRAPMPAQLEMAVNWAKRQKAQKKPIFVHCAFGHGRSVCVMCAVLVGLGLAGDWKEAEKMIKEKRPFIKMNNLHRKSLEDWSKHLIPSSRRSGNSESDASVILSDFIRKKY
ncbi:hypothetical protein LUZ60_001763 [Juncus effusus]|nr:hypothetical protein LUZ60_001763 [Juncus effusus]